MGYAARRLASLLVAIAMTAAVATAQHTDKLFIRGAKIVPVVGDVIEKGNVLIENGKIVAMGADVASPFDARVVEAEGKVVIPGYVESMTARGLDVSNENVPVAPFLQVFDAIDPSDEYFEEALRNGITSIHVSQAENAVVTGVSRVVRPLGLSVEEMTVVPDGGLKICFAPRRGADHAVQLADLRGAFREMDRYLEDLAEKLYEEDLEKKGEKVKVSPKEAREAGKKLVTVDKIDEKYRNLYRIREGSLDVYVWCQRAMDVHAALAFAKEQGLGERMTMVLGSETYKAVKLLKGLSRPVILPIDSFVHREIDRMTQEEKDTFVPSVLAENKIPFAVAGLGEPWFDAAQLVRNGMTPAAALEAITILPARAIGLDHRLGSLEVGKEGNLLILTGDPMDTMTWVDMAVIEGRLVYERAKDKRLRHLIQGIFDTRMDESRKAAAAKKDGEPKKDDGAKKDGSAPAGDEKKN
ncbi:MAG: amidohydrolase family protein [Planctomycetota bacterium]